MSQAAVTARKIREAILSSMPEQQHIASIANVPHPKFLYVPALHRKALDPDNPLVKGIRGAGKSLWWAALQSEAHRKRIGQALGDGSVNERTLVEAGFGTESKPDAYPGSDTLISLLALYDARRIWRTVIFSKVVQDSDKWPSLWAERVKWVVEHPEDVDRVFQRRDRELATEKRRQLVLFDALDRTASDWGTMNQLLRGLLLVLLEFRSYRAIRAKAFVRPDMLADPEVTRFPDASKLLTDAVNLEWSRRELFNLLWQYMANAHKGGPEFRRSCGSKFVEASGSQVWLAPQSLQSDEQKQRQLFHQIAGPYTGTDKRRGLPYTWLPNHLGDALGQVSPRSFLAAVRTAAEQTPPDWSFALHYKSIHQGVQQASKIRVAEIQDDSPWVKTVMDPLTEERVSVPCEAERVVGLWKEDRTITALEERYAPKRKAGGTASRARKGDGRVGPRRLGDGAAGLIADLIDLGIFERMRDGRINMPDVYRVGFGLGRRGGVRPVR